MPATDHHIVQEIDIHINADIHKGTHTLRDKADTSTCYQ